LGDIVLISLFKKKARPGLVGVEVRSDGISVAQSVRSAEDNTSHIVFQDFIACKAAQRKDALNGVVEEHNLKGIAC